MNLVPATHGPTAAPSRLSCRILVDATTIESLRPAWSDLLARSARQEIVQTPDWLLTWWRVYGPQDGRQLRLALFYAGERLVGLVPLTWRRHWYRPGVPFRRLEFLATGERAADAVCSEHVNLLAERGAEKAVADALVAQLAAGAFGSWDEIVFAMMDGEASLPALLVSAFQRTGVCATLTTTSQSPYIPLPPTWDAYLAALPKSNRILVRDSLRRFEKWAGPAGRIHRATTTTELETCRRILIGLHHQRWEGVEQAGVFRSPHFLRFHEEIAPLLFEQNALDMLYLSGPDGAPIAALYNFIWEGKVSFYQSGRKVDVPKNIRPGIVIHAYAIRAAIEAGRREYDFLGGPARYKTQLALASRPIVRVRAWRPSLVESVHRFVEWGANRSRGWRQKLAA